MLTSTEVNEFIIIGITPENPVQDESTYIETMLRSGIDYVHVRHPNLDIEQMNGIIENVDASLRRRIKLHSHFELVEKYGLGGVHLNSRHNEYSGVGARSKSCHTIDELAQSDSYAYVTLSPIYDSISKKGYASGFSLPMIATQMKGRNVIALGGVTPDKLPELRRCGFAGAAMLGFLSEAESIPELKNRITQIKKALCCNT